MTGGELERVLPVVANAAEFTQPLYLRVNEKKPLAALNASADAVRLPLGGSRKSKCKSAAQKALLLLQLQINGTPLGNDFASCAYPLTQFGGRVLRAMADYAVERRLYGVLATSLQLSKALARGCG